MGADLESPGTLPEGAANWGSLYGARDDEVGAARPIFTGDVFRDVVTIDGSSTTVILLQHPCALRLNGVDLNKTLLAAPVIEHQAIPIGSWNGSYKKMPLPEMKDGMSYAALFAEATLVAREELDPGRRIASLSPFGVNLLLQRWVHHNSRVVVPTSDYQKATGAQFEEADLTEEWCSQRMDDGVTRMEAEREAHRWMRSDSGNGMSWQQMLDNAQARSVVRKAMRQALRDL